jgi:hypothetical protein
VDEAKRFPSRGVPEVGHNTNEQGTRKIADDDKPPRWNPRRKHQIDARENEVESDKQNIGRVQVFRYALNVYQLVLWA